MMMEKRSRPRFMISSGRISTTACLTYVATLTVLVLSGCSNKASANDEFLSEKISCPSPAIDEFAPWGKSGTQHICKIKHGPFVAWESGYVHIRGQYEYGKEIGVWSWYDASASSLSRLITREASRKRNDVDT
jgi:hypothetical protein